MHTAGEYSRLETCRSIWRRNVPFQNIVKQVEAMIRDQIEIRQAREASVTKPMLFQVVIAPFFAGLLQPIAAFLHSDVMHLQMTRPPVS